MTSLLTTGIVQAGKGRTPGIRGSSPGCGRFGRGTRVKGAPPIRPEARPTQATCPLPGTRRDRMMAQRTGGGEIPPTGPRPADRRAGADAATHPGEGRSISILGQTRAEMEEWCTASGFPRYRAVQILRWVHRRLVPSFREMTDVPKRLRELLNREGEILTSKVIRRDRAGDGTLKILLRLRDGQTVECVIIPERDRRTACISTQVGCAVRCVFCASGMDGVRRNLTASEMVEQVIHLKRELSAGRTLTNLVTMGMGEPLHNITNLLRAIEILRAPWGADFGARRITVSTSGPPGRIPRLTEAGIPVHLAVSLHAPDDDLRRQMIPGRTSSVEELIAQSREYFQKTGRRVTFEVALVEGLNCDPTLAKTMTRKLRGLPCLVNLIPMNRVPGSRLRPPKPAALAAYRKELEAGGLEVVVRKRKGDRIAAACGQLRMRAAGGSGPTPGGKGGAGGRRRPAIPRQRKGEA